MAATHKLLVFTNPRDGMEDEYNDWYNNVHLNEVCQLPSVTSAQRFELNASLPNAPELTWRYLAIYELENDDASAILDELAKGAPTMQMSAAINRKTAAGWVFSPISDVVTG